MENVYFRKYYDALGATLLIYASKRKVEKEYIELKSKIIDDKSNRVDREEELQALNKAYQSIVCFFS
ncbi:hypothetical protein ACJ2A9_01200 [Anaerobacillus sp. MEB173]|uniref:hypothetical protein n=1 Tax=Anaerobacillus sp. MEB173 TaxID=3383345 RepID=UPI003F8F3298